MGDHEGIGSAVGSFLLLLLALFFCLRRLPSLLSLSLFLYSCRCFVFAKLDARQRAWTALNQYGIFVLQGTSSDLSRERK